jgi:hypothetical protein
MFSLRQWDIIEVPLDLSKLLEERVKHVLSKGEILYISFMNDLPRLYLCNRQLGTGGTDQFMVFNAKLDKKELWSYEYFGYEGS